MSIWTFCLDTDTLCFERQEHQGVRLHVPLSLLRERQIQQSDFVPAVAPCRTSSVINTTDMFPAPNWEPELDTIPERNTAFVARILRDFDRQWRYVFRVKYNMNTLRRFARAIVCIATFDFCLVYQYTKRLIRAEPIVKITDLPEWDPFEANITSVRDTRVVLVQPRSDLDSALPLIQADMKISSLSLTYTRITWYSRYDTLCSAVLPKKELLCTAILNHFSMNRSTVGNGNKPATACALVQRPTNSSPLPCRTSRHDLKLNINGLL